MQTIVALVAALTLFNGKNFDGWEFVATPATDITAVCHYNPDGSISAAGKPIGYLVYKNTYRDYKLHAEWRWPAGTPANSNSGILLNIPGGPDGGTAWPVCFQVQLKVGRAGDLLPMQGAKFAEKLSTPPGAAIPILNRSTTESEKPPGEWNACDIVCRGDTIEVSINGVVQNRVSKTTPAAGKIGFQFEGFPYELRNVRIEPLK
jgi:hypothetical protein